MSGRHNATHGPYYGVHRCNCDVTKLRASLAEAVALLRRVQGDDYKGEMGLFELGLNAGGRAMPDECSFVAEAESVRVTVNAFIAKHGGDT